MITQSIPYSRKVECLALKKGLHCIRLSAAALWKQGQRIYRIGDFSMEKSTTSTTAPTSAPATTASTEEEICGSVNILDTVHLKNLVDDLSKLYGTSVCTKVARDTKVAAEKRLIEAIRANLDRYEG